VLVAAIALGASACGGSPVASSPDLSAGKQGFMTKCAACHTLAEAGAKGTLGPNLDASFLDQRLIGWKTTSYEAFVKRQIEDPTPPMPHGLAEGQDAANIAAYVAAVAAVQEAKQYKPPSD
jgi:mono/diheme cytochrome c family protein